jgi:hypothetical protein
MITEEEINREIEKLLALEMGINKSTEKLNKKMEKINDPIKNMRLQLEEFLPLAIKGLIIMDRLDYLNYILYGDAGISKDKLINARSKTYKNAEIVFSQLNGLKNILDLILESKNKK